MMAFDIRKILVIFAVAILFTLFSYALFDAFYPEVKYEDYCQNEQGVYPTPLLNASEKCEAEGGQWNYYNYEVPKNGLDGYCDINYYCNKEYNSVREDREFYAFIALSILGVIAILIGLYLPTTNPINEWVGTGFMLGGLMNVFFGTAMYYQQIGRFLKPVILFLELALVIFLTYKKLGVDSKPKSKKSKR